MDRPGGAPRSFSGPDVWEPVRAVKASAGAPDERLGQVADEGGLAVAVVTRAIDFYVAFPDEIDNRITEDERAAARLRELIERRERLISG